MAALPWFLAAAFAVLQDRREPDPAGLGAEETAILEAVEVPMVMRGGMPCIEVEVNEQGPFLFAIDTGAMGAARADTSLVEALGLEVVGEAQAGDGTGREGRALDLVELDSVVVGGAEFHGILGYHLFQDCLLTLDYRSGVVRIEEGALPEADGAEVLALEPSEQIAAARISLAGHEVLAHLDSGNLGAVMVPASLADAVPLDAATIAEAQARTVLGTTPIRMATLDGVLRIGAHEIARPRVMLGDAFPAANVGAAVLSGFTVTFDPGNHRVRFQR